MAVTAAQVHAASHDSVQPYRVAEAYEVYSALLPQNWMWKGWVVPVVPINATTTSYAMCLLPDSESRRALAPAIADYVKLNRKRWTLQRQFKIDRAYELITRPAAAWVEVSAVGFNKRKTIAVVYVGHSCGGLCGGGEFHVLQKKDGKWEPLDWEGSACAWMS